jgi:hypothetical protein
VAIGQHGVGQRPQVLGVLQRWEVERQKQHMDNGGYPRSFVGQ